VPRKRPYMVQTAWFTSVGLVADSAFAEFNAQNNLRLEMYSSWLEGILKQPGFGLLRRTRSEIDIAKAYLHLFLADAEQVIAPSADEIPELETNWNLYLKDRQFRSSALYLDTNAYAAEYEVTQRNQQLAMV